MKKDEREAKEVYDKIAKDYHELRTKDKGWFYNEFLEMPATLSLLGNVKNKTILDFGCGSGLYAKHLIKKGAKVYGFDISKKMINIARKEAPKAILKVASGYKIPFNKKFDIVLASLVLDYFVDWNKVFNEIKKHLKKDGYFIFSIGNPVTECVKKIKVNNTTSRVLGDYFKERKIYGVWWRGYKNEIKVPTYHKRYETIIKIILKNGFKIVDYKDAYPKEEAKKLFPKDYKLFSKIPYFCVWKVRN